MSIVRERRGHIEILRINRPEAKNAVNTAVAHGIEEALDDVENDPSVRVVVLTGTGDVFSAGADLKMVAAGDSRGFTTKRGGFGGIVMRDFPKPIIAAVNGTAVAGGFEIALACDLIVAADSAWFGLFEVKRGLFAGGGGLIRLPRRVPLALAMEIAIVGSTIDAAARIPSGSSTAWCRQPKWWTPRSASPRRSPRTRRSQCGTPAGWCATPATSPRSKPGSAAPSCHGRCSRRPTPSRVLARSRRSGHRSGRPPDTGSRRRKVRQGAAVRD